MIPRGDGFRTSPAQQRAWHLERAGVSCRSRCVVRLRGPLPPDDLRQALEAALQRHEVLRTGFRWLAELAAPVQVVAPRGLLRWRRLDAASLPAAAAAAEWEAPGSGEGVPAVCSLLVQHAPDDQTWMLTLSALQSDADGAALLAREVIALCNGTPAGEEVLQYADFAAWWHDERQAAGPPTLPPAVRQGLVQDRLPLAAAPQALASPRRVARPLAPAAVAALGELAAATGGAADDVLLALWQLLLWRLGGSRAPRTTATSTGRRHEELRGAVGPYARALPVAAVPRAGGALPQWLRRLRDAQAAPPPEWETFAWYDLFERTAPALPWTAGFRFLEPPAPASGGRVQSVFTALDERIDAYEAALLVRRSEGAVELVVEHQPEAISAAEAARLGERMETLLLAAAGDPASPVDRLPVLGAEEGRHLLRVGRGTAEGGPRQELSAAILSAAASAGDALAVVAGDGRLTHRDLHRRSRLVAAALRARGVQDGSVVGLVAERSTATLVAMVGVLAAGAAYVPLDPGDPLPRRLDQLRQAHARFALLVSRPAAPPLPGFEGEVFVLEDLEAAAQEPLAGTAAADPDQLAYVVFTSGSTGSPKGVAVSRESIAAYAAAVVAALGLGGGRSFATVSTLSGDLGNTSLFPPLLTGGTVHLVPYEVATDATRLTSWIEHEKVDVLKIVPSHLAALLAARPEGGFLPRFVISGGEALPGALARRVLAAGGSELINHYGPTEATVGCLAGRVAEPPGDEAPVPLGRPLGDAEILILDRHGRRQPLGSVGEICVGGTGLARGYVGRAGETADAFRPHPWPRRPGQRLYATGDRGRLREDGRVEFLGRFDDQVKVRGVRIEPREVEHHLRCHPDVREAAVVARLDGAGEPRLVAYLVPEAPGAARTFAGRPVARLPNGLPVVEQNRHETEFFYRQIFTESRLLRHGIELGEGACVFDVGANIGLFTLAVHRQCAGARIFAFEPIPEIFETLRLNAELHGIDAHLAAVGLGAEERVVPFTYFPRESCMSGYMADPAQDVRTLAAIVANQAAAAGWDEETAQQVARSRGEHRIVHRPLRTLSGVLREHGVETIDLLKVDVEKSEEEVLAGIADDDWRRIRQIVVELHDVDGRLERMAAMLRSRGFEVVTEQDPALRGTDVHDLFARLRTPGGARAATPTALASVQQPDPEQLRTFLRRRVPEAMVPAAMVVLDELPRRPSGKLDRAALPPPEAAATVPRRAPLPPRSPDEAVLAALWSEVLGVEEVGIDDDFFASGGDSIRAIQVRHQAEQRGLAFATPDLVRFPTVRRLAAAIRERRTESDEVPAVDAFDLLSPQDRGHVPEGVEDALPLSALQIGMLFHAGSTRGSGLYHDLQSFHLEMPFEEERWSTALAAAMRRHPVLRTRFDLTSFSEPVQLVEAEVAPPLEIEDLRHLSSERQERHLEEWVDEERRRGFDVARAPLFRLRVVRRSESSLQLLLGTHHAILDGWSNALLLTELLSAVRGEVVPPGGPEAAAFRQTLALERRALGAEESRRHWRSALEGVETVLLPRCAESSRERGERRVETVDVALPPELSAALEDLARRLTVPVKSLLLACHLRVLAHWTGRRAPVTGVVTHTRPESAGGDRGLGLFLNTLPLRLDCAGAASWEELAVALFAAERELYRHRHYPLARIQIDHGRQVLFETYFDFVHFHAAESLRRLEGLRLLGWQAWEETNFTLAAVFRKDLFTGLLHLRLFADAAVLGGPRIAAIADSYRRAAAALAAAPRRAPLAVELLTAAERRSLAAAEGAVPVRPPELVPQRFLASALARPDAVAVRTGHRTLSYGELRRRASVLLGRLRQRGIGREDLVAVYLPRTSDLLVAMLAVHASGAAYLPLVPGAPRERTARILADARPRAVLTTGELAGSLPGEGGERILVAATAELPAQRATTPWKDPDPDSLAYVLYTSGSTGEPKGVQVSHGSLTNLLSSMERRLEAAAGQRLLALTPVSFDISALELLLPLVTGGEVHLWPEETLDATRLAAALANDGVQRVQATPSTWRLLLEAGWRGDPSLTVLAGGEALDADLAGALEARSAAVWNLYGPTETTIWSTAWPLPARRAGVFLGEPLDDTRLHVVGEGLARVPRGVAGELWIGGGGLARGYLGRPAQTAERFVPDPFGERPGQRLYRTGDLVRWSDGGLEFLGRIDDQVKVRGHRIELGEVEAALRAHPAVRQAVVGVHDRQAGDRRLVAWLLTEGQAVPDGGALRRFLAPHLPEHAIPAAFLHLAELPRTPSGKIDRRALPAPGARPANETYVAPRGGIESEVAAVWCEVLGEERVGIDDNFFDLGGHSLLMVQMHGRLVRRFPVELSILELFEYPTVRSMAARLGEGGGAESAGDEQARLDELATGRARLEARGRRMRRLKGSQDSDAALEADR